MPLQFKEELRLMPIAAAARVSARQATIIQRRLAASNLNQIRAEALAAINNTSPADEASEIKRLRLLYQAVYTQDELARFVAASLAELGFTD
jgi:hypothetical protein